MCLRIWSCDTASAIPSRASLLISILRLNQGLTYDIHPQLRGGVYLFIVSKSMDQPGKVADAARGQLNIKKKIPVLVVVVVFFTLTDRASTIPSNTRGCQLFAPENLVSRDGCGSPVPRQPALLHTQAESGAYLRDSSRVPRRRPFIYFKTLYVIESVPSLSGHAVAYRWRSLPRVRRYRATKYQGSSERVLPWQVPMDQLICGSLSHTHYWDKVGMLKVPSSLHI